MKERRFMTAGELARKINKPYTTVATWLRKGQVPGAIPQLIGDFRIWMVPEEAVDTWPHWQPKPGRPPLTDAEKAARAKNRTAGIQATLFEPTTVAKPARKAVAKKDGKKATKKKGEAK